MTNNNHEVIFAIVNAGFAEDVMDVAREQGVRGGTILNARGVAREKEAAFFGITIQQEKEILMMVVEKDIKDKVLNALYKEMADAIENLICCGRLADFKYYNMDQALERALQICEDL